MRQQRWYSTHKEYRAHRSREYRAVNHESILAHDRLRNQDEKRRSSLRESARIRRQINPGKHTDRIRRYQARMLHAPRIEKIDRQALIERDNWTCYLCGAICTPKTVTLDHVIPLYYQGSHTADNLRVACRPCNSSKGTKPLGEFLR